MFCFNCSIIPKHNKKKAPVQPVKIPDFQTRYFYGVPSGAKVNKGIDKKMWKSVKGYKKN